MDEDRQLQKLQQILEIVNKDYVDPEEFIQAFEVVLKLLATMKEDTSSAFDDVEEKVKSVEKTLNQVISAFNKKFDELTKKDDSEMKQKHEEMKQMCDQLMQEMDSMKESMPTIDIEEMKKDLMKMIPEQKEETPEETVDKVNQSKKLIKKEKIEGLSDLERITRLNAERIYTGISETRALELIRSNTTSTGTGAVDSVNGKTGVVILTTADIADSLNKRYVTDAQLTVLGNTSGTNTGDQDLSGYLTSATASSTYQPLDTQLTDLAGLAYTGNGGKYIRVKATEDGWEFATVSGGSLSDGDYGDITVGGSGTTMTIDNDVVTYAKMQNVSATSRILGRITAGAGDVEELTAANVKTILSLTASDIGLGNVDNTSDATKNSAVASLTNKDLTSGTNTFPTFNQNTTGSAAKWTTARNLAGNSVDGSANVAFANKFIVQGTTDTGLSGAQFLGALGTGILKNTTTTGVLSIAVAGDFPTLNQNTTGSAATLTTARAIYGNNFDGSAALTQIIASTYGGTGNGFTKFTGPTTAEKTFTLPDANATLLYSGGALGTPSSGTLTNCTGLPIAGLTASTSTALGVGSIELGHATDTTIARVSAGVVSIEGVNIATVGATQTFTGQNKFNNLIDVNNAITASANAATVPVTYRLNTVTNNSAATLTITMTTTSAVDGQMTIVRILDASAVAQTISWVNTENSTVSAPTTSNGSTTLPLTVGFMYNGATSKWRCIASA